MAATRLNLVVAACNNGGIGIDGRIPWRIKKDMEFFRKITSTTQDKGKKNAVIMGRKTWFSIPEKFRPLPKRINVILSQGMKEAPEKAYLARNLPEAIEMLTTGSLGSEVESVFIIGGSSVYEEAMTSGSFPCRLYLTRVLGDFKCDTFISSVDDCGFHRILDAGDVTSETLTENDIDFKFEVYEKECVKKE